MTTSSFDEMTPARIKCEVDEQHPELRPFLDRLEQALYNAVWVGGMFDSLAGFDSATGKFLADNDLTACQYDTEFLDQAANLFLFAFDDAWFEAVIAGAGYEVEHLDRVPRCPKCEGFVRIDCTCEVKGSLEVADIGAKSVPELG